jgi:hypothetical protein
MYRLISMHWKGIRRRSKGHLVMNSTAAPAGGGLR